MNESNNDFDTSGFETSALAASAGATFDLYVAYVDAGFTTAQAFQIILTQIVAVGRGGVQ